MAKPKDPLAVMPPAVRAKFMRDLAVGLFGPVAGAAFAKQMESVQKFKGRQIGDAPEPEKNFWKGAWRIHEID